MTGQTELVNLILKLREQFDSWKAFADAAEMHENSLKTIGKGKRGATNRMIQKLAKYDNRFEKFIEIRQCMVCGKSFKPVGLEKTCSKECILIRKRENFKEWQKKNKDKPKEHKPVKPIKLEKLSDPYNSELATVNQMARDAGLSYGQYQAMNRRC